MILNQICVFSNTNPLGECRISDVLVMYGCDPVFCLFAISQDVAMAPTEFKMLLRSSQTSDCQRWQETKLNISIRVWSLYCVA